MLFIAPHDTIAVVEYQRTTPPRVSYACAVVPGAIPDTARVTFEPDTGKPSPWCSVSRTVNAATFCVDTGGGWAWCAVYVSGAFYGWFQRDGKLSRPGHGQEVEQK